MAIYRGTGELIPFTADSACLAGQLVTSPVVGFAAAAVTSGGVGALITRGVFEHNCGATVSAGAACYDHSGTVNTTSSGGVYVGKAIEAGISGGTIKVLL